MSRPLRVIRPDTNEWLLFIANILSGFNTGDIISHEYLKHVLNIQSVDIADYNNTDDFVKAIQESQFEYMALIDKLRDDLLYTENYYLQNIKGEGYRIMPPKEQSAYAYNRAIKDIKHVLKKSSIIMNHVRLDEIDSVARSKASDLSAKLSRITQLFSTLRK